MLDRLFLCRYNRGVNEGAGMAHTVVTEEDVRETMNRTDTAFLRLWDLYGGLLTEKQREITGLYLECDLSLGEIAEEKEMSRAGVSDCLHQSRRKLEEAEGKLHFCALLDGVSLDYSTYRTRVLRWILEQEQRHPEWAEELSALKQIRGNDEEEIVEIVE